MRSLILFILSGLFLTGCFFSEGDQLKVDEIHEIKGLIFGSNYSIKYVGPLKETAFRPELERFFKEFNDEFSTYQKNSVISHFNDLPANKRLRTSARFIQMLNFAKGLYERSAGAFDPTLGPVIKLWGFGGGERKGVPTEKILKEALSKVGIKKISWDSENFEVWKSVEGVQLDVNAFAPGWAGDLIGKMLEGHGILNFMVDISGEILIKGEKPSASPWVIGIERPSVEYGESVQMALKLKDIALATSGSYRQFFDDQGKRRSHIIDPRTGRPVVHEIVSATVLSNSSAEADAWSTAMMVLGVEGLNLAEILNMRVYLLEAKKEGGFNVHQSPAMSKFMVDAQL